MSAEMSALLSEVRVNIEHSPVVMAHHPQTVVFHGVSDPGGANPFRNFSPGCRVVVKRACYLEKRNAAAVEDIGDFRHRTSLAVGQPFSGHLGAVAQAIEPVIVNGRRGTQIQNDDGHLSPPDDRQDGGRERIGCNVEEDEIDVGAPELVARREGLLGGVDQSQIHYLGARPFELLSDLPGVAL